MISRSANLIDFELRTQHPVTNCPTRREIGLAVVDGKLIIVTINDGEPKLLTLLARELHNEGLGHLELVGPVPDYEALEFVINLVPETGTGWVMVRMIKHP